MIRLVAEIGGETAQEILMYLPRVICNVYENCSADDKGYLLSCIKTGNPKYFQLKKTFLVDSYRRTAAGEIVAGYHTFRESAARYLLGEIEISEILPVSGAGAKCIIYQTVRSFKMLWHTVRCKFTGGDWCWNAFN